ncbi:MAG: hypothetical protein KF760_33355 [Candidatus Eremiobacteraeota bacterium]|nr:hypothetical protein [Candidatus Eremiobacteraeota bacterium]
MKRILIATLALLAIGCSQAPTSTAASPATATAQTAYDLGSKKKGDKGHCAVCVVKEGKPAEETVAETLDYQGKTYVFCNEKEKAEFISEPARFAAQ